MSFLSWLRNWMPTTTRERRRTRVATRKSASFRPRLETLEGRDVPSTLTVTNTLDSGHGSLRYEIAQAEKSGGKDTVVFNVPKSDPGYSGSTGAWTITLGSGELDITGSLKIQGPGAGLLTISGDYISRVFAVEQNVTVALSGLTVSHGNGEFSQIGAPHPYDGDGGGILNLGKLTVSDCRVSTNQPGIDTWGGGPGAGICNFGALTLSSCTVSGNCASGTGAPGGGIYNQGTLMVSGCTVFGNIAGGAYGGGIYNAGTLTVSSSTFYTNSPDNIYGSYTDGGGNSFS
jgi:hypothetical protein